MPTAVAARRLGWLLRTNRRLGPNPALRSGRTFARAFRTDPPLAPSHITRWECGDLAPSAQTIRRYEQLLGLSGGTLSAVAATIQRFEGSPVREPVSAEETKAQLHDLLSRARTTAEMDAADWTTLCGLIAARPQLELHPPGLWSDISDRLLSELVVDVDSSWLQRQEAFARLLEHPDAGRHAIESCIALADDAASPAVVEPLSLLGGTGQPRANRYILAQLAHPTDERTLRGALLATHLKIRHDHFVGGEWDRLGRILDSALRDSTLTPEIFGIVADAAQRLARRTPTTLSVMRSLRLPRAVEYLRHRPPFGPITNVCRRLSAAAQAATERDNPAIDDILIELIESAVFAANPDSRLYATMSIAASPYRSHVAQALLSELSIDLSRRSPIVPLAPALRALTQLDVDIHRPLLRILLTSPHCSAASRHAAAWAIPHCRGSFPASVWHDILATQLESWRTSPSSMAEQVLLGVVYGMGTDGHRHLLSEVRSGRQAPQSVRSMAAWQLAADPRRRHGPATTP
jgi:hypothetical protein